MASHQIPMANDMPQESNHGNSIPLARLMDFMIQKTYDELIVLSDTLGSHSDMERKISIYKYAEKSRILFTKLLALVKWANNISKVNNAASAITQLDNRSLLFADTADQLARLSRETLVTASLPNFDIVAATEVLTTGTFKRLPACIKDRIVPSDPITPAEKKSTLQRLSQVIQQRLVTEKLLPQMLDIKIEAGRVTIHVPNEFSMCLTLMGDGPDVPWRLLELEFLVSDRETGSGTALVHPLQNKYMHQLVQARLLETPNLLTDAYYVLHNFCQSLQLEVLYLQTLRLMQDRLNNDIQVDQYKPGERLTVSYWRELTIKYPELKLCYKLTVHMDQENQAEPLGVINIPSFGIKENGIADRMINGDQLSMESLLVHTINARTYIRLSELKLDLQNMIKNVECSLAGFPTILSVKVLQPCLPAELLNISINTYTGMLQCNIEEYEAQLVSELSAAVNDDRSRLPVLISDLRFWITQRRCKKTLQHLPVTTHDQAPIIFEPNHPMITNGKRRVFVKFEKHPSVILIVEFKEKESFSGEMEYTYHLAAVRSCLMDRAFQNNKHNDSFDNDIPKLHYRVESLTEFDTFVVTHGPNMNIDIDLSSGGTKRPNFEPSSQDVELVTSQSKKMKHSAYFIPELAYVVALCDERIPFVSLAHELNKRGIPHQGLQVDTNATAIVLKILQLPSPSSDPNIVTAWKSLMKRLLGISIRMRSKDSTMSLMVEFVFYSSPLTTSHPKEQVPRRPVYCSYFVRMAEALSITVNSLLEDWEKMVHLYSIVDNFSAYLNTEKHDLKDIVDVKSYTYNQLVLGYGPDHKYRVTIYWSISDKSFKLDFIKSLATTSINGHSLLKNQLEAHLNRHHNLAQLIQILHETLQPCISINKLSTMPQVGIIYNRSSVPIKTFTIIAQCPTIVRIYYQATYCLEVRFRDNGYVTIRDGTYSRFDRSNVINEFTPTQGLKTFLSKYEETPQFKQHSQTEDDNPPSPISMDIDVGNGFMSRHQTNSISPAKRDSLRFRHNPLTPPSASNPHTPASPHTMNMQATQHQNYVNSPAASYNLSPSSMPPNTPNMMPHPSPGSGFVPSSPMNIIHAPSPANYIDAPLTSPFSSQTMTSPAASNWPASPSVPKPSPVRPGQSPGCIAGPSSAPDYRAGGHVSRVLPQKAWAGAVPTFLSHQTFDLLCTPSVHPSGVPGMHIPPLERFLACVYLKRQLQRFLQNDSAFTLCNGTEPGAVYFKVETLQCRIALNNQHMQSLHIKMQPISEHKDKWTGEEIQIYERFFDINASSTPYKASPIVCLCKMLSLPINILKDFIQIMKLELNSHEQQYQSNWSVQWSLKIPPSLTPAMLPYGAPAIIYQANKILFFLKITKIENQNETKRETPSLILPLLYDCSTNIMNLFEKKNPVPKPILSAVSMHLKRFAEFTKLQVCSIFPAVRNLIIDFTLPSEQPVTSQAPVATTINSQVSQVKSAQQVRTPAT
ncbi:GSCOCG00007749001-RA-CDS [Cotesia congregata]|uniref:Mediator of RNA polymerase II transcription subunit 14 n=1 Tax=Cotesia congregata TaxID=51543 RepID=A0A8J2HNB9_COTCN|nr:GSCOCG00007749001-RA-CDS [Cotesia congregata]CAG5103433.1 Similar to MED14: Mediator of RNA polymerase II transcription subunit 14 (Aedes aegypti) [Cotesia congregata]